MSKLLLINETALTDSEALQLAAIVAGFPEKSDYGDLGKGHCRITTFNVHGAGKVVNVTKTKTGHTFRVSDFTLPKDTDGAT